MPQVIQKGRKPKTKCFTVPSGKVVCEGSKGAKKNFNQKKIKQRRATGRLAESRWRYDKKERPDASHPRSSQKHKKYPKKPIKKIPESKKKAAKKATKAKKKEKKKAEEGKAKLKAKKTKVVIKKKTKKTKKTKIIINKGKKLEYIRKTKRLLDFLRKQAKRMGGEVGTDEDGDMEIQVDATLEYKKTKEKFRDGKQTGWTTSSWNDYKKLHDKYLRQWDKAEKYEEELGTDILPDK